VIFSSRAVQVQKIKNIFLKIKNKNIIAPLFIAGLQN